MSAAKHFESLESRQLCSASPLDPTFDGDGKLTIPLFAAVNRTLVETNGTILIASAQDSLLQGKGVISRFLPNGNFDPSFRDPNGSNTGYQVTPLTTDIGLASNNEIFAVGGGTLQKLQTNGLVDPSFHAPAIPGSALRLAVTTNDQVLVAYSDAAQHIKVRHYLADGSLDKSYGVNGDLDINHTLSTFDFRDLSVTFDGKAVVFGNTNTSDGSVFTIVRLDGSGHFDSSFGAGGLVDADVGDRANQRVFAGAVTPDNKYLIGGQVDNEMVVARFNSDGSIDNTFNGNGVRTIPSGAFSIVRAITTGPDGAIYLAGRTNGSDNANGDFEVVRLTRGSGSLDPTFGNNGFATADLGTNFDGATSIAVANNGRVIAGGFIFNDSFAASLRTGVAVFTGPVEADADDQISEAHAVSLNSTVSDKITAGGDVDLYKVTVAAGQRVSFDIDRPAGSLFDPRLEVFNAAGTQIAANDGGVAPTAGPHLLGPAPIDPYLDYTFPTAGTFYVGVSSHPNQTYNVVNGNDGDTRGFGGAYTLKIHNLSNVANSHDKLSTAIALPTSKFITTGFIDGKDVLLVKVNLTKGQVLGSEVDVVGGQILPYLRIFDATGKQLAAASVTTTGGPLGPITKKTTLTFNAGKGGTFYVGISSSPNQSYNAVTGAGDVAGKVGSFNAIFNVTTPILGGLITKKL